MKYFRLLPWIVLVLAAYGLGRCGGGNELTDTTAGEGEVAEDVTWTCPMHPSIQFPENVPCPICGMDLVIAEEGGGDPRQLTMTEAGRALAEIQTAPVRRRAVTRLLRMSGKVEFDETRIRTLSAWVAGRIDRLFVDYTGIPVREGDHLVTLYGPDLLTAQQVLLEAKKRLDSPDPGGSEFLENVKQRAYEAAREKLLLWGLREEQVDEIEDRGTAEDNILIKSPISGIVIYKSLNEGDYVKTGAKIYEIADLDVLWVQLDVYEQDLPWVRYGQEVTVQAEAYPGEVFQGRISFVSPTVEELTRTVKVRVNIDNAEGLLKPGMFVRATVHAPLAAGGQLMDPGLEGKWISPMHPEIIKDGPGDCDVCGMDLVPVEELGFVAGPDAEAPLVVPESAVLRTGRRAVVYVEIPDASRIAYEGREVILGPSAEGFVVVVSGIEEGDRVVTHGAFKIDSAMQIQARPSMMSLRDDSRFHGPQYAMFRASLRPLMDAYFLMSAALADDDEGRARGMIEPLRLAVEGVNEAALTSESRVAWSPERARLVRGAKAAHESEDIEGFRVAFQAISRAALGIESLFAHAGRSPYYEAYCPMAFDDSGAAWLQNHENILNPYFGDQMLRCGVVRATLPGVVSEAERVPRETAIDEESSTGEPERPASPSASAESRRYQPGIDASKLYDAYFAVQRALGDDDLNGAKEAGVQLSRRIQESFEDLAAVAEEPVMILRGAAHRGRLAVDLVAARREFQTVSENLLKLIEVAPPTESEVYYEISCSMAFGGMGGTWLQDSEDVFNPYYGAEMLTCGSVVAEHRAEDQ